MPDTEYESCLVTHLQTYMELSRPERRLIEMIEADEEHHGPHVRVQRQGAPARQFFVLKRGWLLSGIDLPDRRRHVLQIHHPGDVIGLQNAPFTEASCDLTSLEDCVLCPFDRSGLGIIMERQPRLGALMVSVSARDQLVAKDLKRATTRYGAADRLLFLLLQLLHRLRLTNAELSDTLRLPMNQHELGDTVGLTNVSVSKAFGELEQEGWLTRRQADITLLRLDEAILRLDFENRYTRMDTSWFPPVRDE